MALKTIMVAAAACLSAAMLTHPALAEADCEELDGITSICGLSGPEDLMLTPDGHLLFTQMSAGRGLSLLELDTLTVSQLYRAADQTAEPGWGEPDCLEGPGEQVLAHGMDLARRPDGRWQLLVTNHGGRESVEVFEYVPGETPYLDWRGCVLLTEGLTFNDVASLPDGGFLGTHQYTAGEDMWSLLKAMLGFDTGVVYRWSPQKGLQALAGTEAPFPNGIVAAADGETFFVNSWAGSEVRKYSLNPVALLGVVEIPNPDNSNWTSDGKLLIASHRMSWAELGDAFPRDDGSPSPMKFAIVELDPDTLEYRDILVRQGPPMGAGTAAIHHGGYLYIGSFLGDRMIRVPEALLQ